MHVTLGRLLPLLALIAWPWISLVAADPTGLKAEYYSREDFTGTKITRVDSTVNFNWGSGGPGIAGIGATQFSVVWSGRVTPQFSESYTFYTNSDDGVLLWVDGKLLVNNYTLHAATENNGTLTLTAGKSYDIVMRYYQYKGNAVAQLSWSSPSTPKAIIPTACLQAADSPGILSILTDVSCRTSPAWVEGTAMTATSSLTATVAGSAAVVTRQNSDGWYLSSSAAGQPLGVPLSSTLGSTKAVVVMEGSTSVTASLSWALTDMANLPYGLEDIVVRAGDQLLLGVTGTGTSSQIDTNYNGTTFVPTLSGTPASRFPVSFTTPGTFVIRGRRDGIEIGRLTVYVVSVNFQGPIADNIGFKRIKDIAINPVAAAPDVTFTSKDPQAMLVSFAQSIPTGAKINLQPVTPWAQTLQARIGGPTGPIISQQSVDVFSIHTTAEKYVTLVQGYPDGSLLTQAKLTMTPLITNLDISMHVFISGVTFANSTLDLNTNTNAFTSVGSAGEFTYQLIQAPGGYYHLCHTIKVKQAGVAISP